MLSFCDLKFGVYAWKFFDVENGIAPFSRFLRLWPSRSVKQVAQIVDHVARERFKLPTLLAGDFNIGRDDVEGKILLPFLVHGYTLKKPIPRAVRFGEFSPQILRSSSVAETRSQLRKLARASNALGRKRCAGKFTKDDRAGYTCTNLLTQQWDQKAPSVRSETIDYISLFKSNANGTKFTDCHRSRAFGKTYDTKTALSDHHAVVATIQFARKNSI